jgi:hypothetical protein
MMIPREIFPTSGKFNPAGHPWESVSPRKIVALAQHVDPLGHIEPARLLVRQQRIFDLWLACYTQTEIAKKVGVKQQNVAERLKVLPESRLSDKSVKLLAAYDVGFDGTPFEPPLYTIWSQPTNRNCHSAENAGDDRKAWWGAQHRSVSHKEATGFSYGISVPMTEEMAIVYAVWQIASQQKDRSAFREQCSPTRQSVSLSHSDKQVVG